MIGRKRKKNLKITTLIGRDTELRGDIVFSGGLHIDGIVKGGVIGTAETSSILTLSEQGRVEGEVNVPYVMINGTVVGDVKADQRVELGEQARISGDVHYRLIEMAIGAEVNGQLVHSGEPLPAVDAKGRREPAMTGSGLVPPGAPAADS